MDQCTEIKWCWSKFFVGMLSKKFIAFVTYMVIQCVALFSGLIANGHIGALIIVSAIVTIIFMLAGAIDKAVENMKITASLKAGVSK